MMENEFYQLTFEYEFLKCLLEPYDFMVLKEESINLTFPPSATDLHPFK
jgi:hypothetical protein